MSEHKVLACSFALKELSEEGQFEGHAAMFGNVDLQGDRIRRGAFKETLEESAGQWPVLFGHNTGRVVGFSTWAEEDTKGLHVKGEFTLSSDEGRNAYATVKHAEKLKQKFGLSIGYAIRGEDGAHWDQETNIRTLKNLTVYEFSLAAIPANPRARMSQVKSAGEWSLSEFENFLREAGFSKTEATAIASRGLGSLHRREAESEEEKAARIISELQGKSILFEMRGH
jgi:uncharacterized protein